MDKVAKVGALRPETFFYVITTSTLGSSSSQDMFAGSILVGFNHTEGNLVSRFGFVDNSWDLITLPQEVLEITTRGISTGPMLPPVISETLPDRNEARTAARDCTVNHGKACLSDSDKL